MATKITKSELKQMIREALREELSTRNTLIEAADPDQAKRLKKSVVMALMNVGNKAGAKHIYNYDFAISDTIKPDTVEVNGNVITVHSGFLDNSRKFSRLLNVVTQATSAPSKAGPVGDPNSKLVYVLTTFRGKTLIYDDFYDAVTDAEGDLAMEANMIDTMYQSPDGTLTEVSETDPNYHRWTEEEGIKA